MCSSSSFKPKVRSMYKVSSMGHGWRIQICLSCGVVGWSNTPSPLWIGLHLVLRSESNVLNTIMLVTRDVYGVHLLKYLFSLHMLNASHITIPYVSWLIIASINACHLSVVPPWFGWYNEEDTCRRMFLEGEFKLVMHSWHRSTITYHCWTYSWTKISNHFHVVRLACCGTLGLFDPTMMKQITFW